jgi:ribosome biogenesis GTPase
MERARVIAEYRASYDVLHEGVVYTASLRGHFHEAAAEGFPKVGDYVAVESTGDGRLVIEDVLPRTNAIARLAPHDNTLQVMVTNIDYMLIVMGLDGDFNISRLERYLALAAQSEVAPVVVLNKSDVAPDLPAQLEAVTAVAQGTPIVVGSAITGTGMELLLPYVAEGKTVVLLGSSGAGKSTITNYLVAAVAQPTRELRERDGRGRHTTTHRQLFVLPTGGFLIDTPGMRELALV